MKYGRAYESCELCPRACRVNRRQNKTGYCHMTSEPEAARAALHMWEEPCISGENGSGTVFFTGCNMGCVFCQNHDISGGRSGKKISAERLTEIFFELAGQGANNINLVTPDHFVPSVREAIEAAKSQGFRLPFLYNTSSYVAVDTLKMLDGLIDIYLPDFKYMSKSRAAKYSAAKDYPETAKAAIDEMVRQIRCKAGSEGAFIEDMREKSVENPEGTGLCSFDERGIMKRGVIVRHLLMPGGLLEAKLIVKYLYQRYGEDIYISLMNQYTPIPENLSAFPELERRVTEREYDSLIDYAVDLGVKKGFMQEGEAVGESFIPPFDYEGV